MFPITVKLNIFCSFFEFQEEEARNFSKMEMFGNYVDIGLSLFLSLFVM
jgi:hypothetical protein